MGSCQIFFSNWTPEGTAETMILFANNLMFFVCSQLSEPDNAGYHRKSENLRFA
jgi:hypothetical protein